MSTKAKPTHDTYGTTVEVLHVDDERSFLEMSSEFLERNGSRFEVETSTSADEALDMLNDGAFDCVVSDYSMPEKNGIEFLKEVRDVYPDLPFILFTGKGSEEVASEAISAGVTDYLQKEPGTEQYTVLANRIENAVSMHRSERELRERTKQLRAVLDTVPASVFMKDDEGGYLLMNQNCREMFGVDNDEVTETKDSDVFPEETVEGMREDDRKVLEEGETVESEEKILTPEGQRVLLTIKSPVLDDNGEPHAVCGVSTDITERREREKELAEHEQFLETVSSNVPVVVFALDEEGVFTRSEGDALGEIGLEPGEVVGESISEVYGKNSEIREHFECALEGESVRATVEEGDRIFESWYEPLENGGYSGTEVVGLSYDITERERREKELERYEAFVEKSSDVLTHVGEDGTVLYQSPAVEHVFGYEHGETVGDKVFEYAHPEDRECVVEEFYDIMNNPERHTGELEFRVRDADGDYVWVEAVGTDHRETETGGFVVNLRDITERKEREKELERYEAFVENSSDVVIHIDENGEMVYLSPGLERILGREPEDRVGKNAFKYIHPDDRERTIEEFYNLTEDSKRELEEIEIRMENEDGEYVWIEVAATDQTDTELGGVIASLRDITERKEREKELERYEALVENTSDVVTLVDEDGTVLYQSPSVERVLGYDHEEVAGKNVFEYVHLDDRGYLMEEFSELLRDSETEIQDAEYRFLRSDGETVWLESSVTDRTDTELGGFVVVSRDITERKERDEELRKTKERLGLAIESAGLGIWDWDVEEDVVEYNDRWAEMLGMASEDAGYDMKFREENAHPEDLPEVNEELERHVAGETDRFEAEYRMRTAEGDWKWIRTVGQAVERGDDGTAKRVVGVHVDVDERKEREKELERYEAFIQNSSDSITHVDEDGLVLYRNPSTERIEDEPEGFEGSTAFEHIHPKDRKRVEKAFEELLEGDEGSFRIEYRAGRADGGYEWVEAVANDQTDTEVGGVVVNTRVIEDRKKREKELERYETFIQNSSDIITHIDEDGTILYQSPSAERILGHEHGERVGDNAFDYVHPDDREHAIEKFESVRKETNDTVDDIEFRYQRADGSYVWLEINGSDQRDTDIGGVVVNSREITERKEYKEELKRSQDLLSRTERISDTGGWEIDLETGDVRWTAGMHDVFGVPEGYEPTLEESIESYHPTDRDVIRHAVENCREEGEPFDEELRIEVEDSFIWVHVRGEPVREDGEVVGIRGSVRDITEIKNREKELERSQDLLNQTERIADTGGWEVDPESGRQRWTEGTYRIHAVGRDYEPTVEDGIDFYHPEDRDTIRRAVENCREEGDPFDEELRLVTADGDARWVRVSGEPVYGDGEVVKIRGSIRDITERKNRETELLRNNKSVRELYEITSDPDLSFEDKIDMVLESCRSRLGLPYAFVTDIDTGSETQKIEYARGSHELLQPGESCPLEQSYCRKTIEGDGLLVVHEASEEGWEGDEAYEKFGHGCYIGAKLTVDDELYGTLCFADTEARQREFTDFERTLVELVANWVSYELERKTSKERLRRQKERLDDFASVVSHDLRSPLAVLKGNLELAEETGDADYFDKCRDAMDRMERLTDDLLSLARDVDGAEMTRNVDLPGVIEECWRNVPTEDAELEVETDDKITADEGKLRLMLHNILKNSVEHGGYVTVTVSDVEGGFRIEDDGPGMSEEDRDRVFEPGYSTSDDGTGLGMYIAEQVAEAHGWEVDVVEGRKKGAAFDITGVERNGK